MNKYESIIIIGQNVNEEGIKALITKFTDLINQDRKSFKCKRNGTKKASL